MSGPSSKVAPRGVLSLNPAKFSEGGAMTGPDLEIVAIQFEMYSFPKSDGTLGTLSGVPEPCLLVKVAVDGAEIERGQYYGAGSYKNVEPSEDGKTLINISGREAPELNKTCGAALFFAAVCMSGFPAEKLDAGDVGVLLGEHFAFEQIAAPGAKPDAQGNIRKTPMPVQYLGEGTAPAVAAPQTVAKPAAGKPAATKPAVPAAPAAGVPDESDVTLAIHAIASAAPGGAIAKAALVQAMNKHLKEQGQAAHAITVLKTYLNDTWLGAGGGGLWEYEGGQVKVAA